jgi:hypothetical protein
MPPFFLTQKLFAVIKKKVYVIFLRNLSLRAKLDTCPATPLGLKQCHEREWSRVARMLVWIRKTFDWSNHRTRSVGGGGTPTGIEGEAARAHLEGAEPADLLDDEHGPQRFGARFRVRSESEVTDAPQPCTVEAMCKANWPAQRRPTEAGRILERIGLEGGGGRHVASPRGSGVIIEGAGDVATRGEDGLLTRIVSSRT